MKLYHQVRNMLTVLIIHLLCLCSLHINLCCVSIGWTVELKEGTLFLYKTGPEFVLSLTICEDFSWNLSFRRQCVKQELCCLLRDMPSKIKTGMQYVLIRNWYLATVDSSRTGMPSIYHVNGRYPLLAYS